MKNLAFWIKLKSSIKILAFCILSFQSSCHFAFCISWGTKHSLNSTERLSSLVLMASQLGHSITNQPPWINKINDRRFRVQEWNSASRFMSSDQTFASTSQWHNPVRKKHIIFKGHANLTSFSDPKRKWEHNNAESDPMAKCQLHSV
jgi:hypothetical protein